MKRRYERKVLKTAKKGDNGQATQLLISNLVSHERENFLGNLLNTEPRQLKRKVDFKIIAVKLQFGVR